MQKKNFQIARECTSSYVGYRYNERTIAYVIMDCDSNEMQDSKAADNNVIYVYTLHFEHPSKEGTKAGSCTPVRTMKWIGCNPYANCLVGV